MHSNVVGYKSEALQGNDFNMVGASFIGVSSDGADLNRDFTCTGVSGSDWADSDVCDFIHVYVNGSGYYFFYYNTVQNKWCGNDDDQPFDTYFPQGIPAGTSMWIEGNPNVERTEALSCTFSGAVKSAASVSMPNVQGNDFNMICNPYPVAYSLNDDTAVQFAGVSGSDWADSDVCDFIHVYVNGSGYYFFYYNTVQNKWCGNDDDQPFETYFADGITSCWWLEGNPNVERTDALGVTFYSPIAE